MGTTIGIDLGTTYSAIAFINKDGKAEIIPNREGERITPSVVLFDDDDEPLVGSIAKQSASSSPLDTVQFAKRRMGEALIIYSTESGKDYTPEDISAIILKRLKEDAETALGETITDAVVSVPAYFDDAQRKATQHAGDIAGLNILRIINEPTAAALAYGIENNERPETVLVYDLGGGTFDVTIMKVDANGVTVLATGGNRILGGFDWDNALMEYLNEEFKKQTEHDLFDDPACIERLRSSAEKTKKSLSSRNSTKVFISEGGQNISIKVTLELFNEITRPLLNRTGGIMNLVLEDAQLQWSNIDKILLVGGSTRMKCVAEFVEETTGIKPSIELHPDEIVAMGAAVQASMINNEENGKIEAVQKMGLLPVQVKDVNAHSLGTIILDENTGIEKNDIAIKKDTLLPAETSKVYHTVDDNQTSIHIRITQGESDIPRDVTTIGESIAQIEEHPKGAPFRFNYQYDLNGLIQITVFDLTTNKHVEKIEIRRVANLNRSDIQSKQKRMSNTVVN
ncbi:MAG: hypothetical protein D3907_00110 [Candidatus Electrothrix sp. AUS3]|nr:hypothetical protein [Candidatus Electrothrix gigas]